MIAPADFCESIASIPNNKERANKGSFSANDLAFIFLPLYRSMRMSASGKVTAADFDKSDAVNNNIT